MLLSLLLQQLQQIWVDLNLRVTDKIPAKYRCSCLLAVISNLLSSLWS